MLKLRDYQKEAIEKVTQEWDKGKKNTLLIMPTGTGKTIVFTSIINQIVKNDDSKKKKVLILAQRGELLKQAGEKLDNIFNIPSALEKAQSFALNASEPVTLGSMQSFKQDKRLESYPKDYFDTIIIDEAHHTMSESYLKIIKHFDSAKLLGVTATPERNDKQKLGDVYDSIAYEYKIYEAIENKDLCPIVAKFDPMKINIRNVKVKDNNFNMQEIGEIVDKHIQCLSHRLKEHCKGKKAVIFFPQIETAQKYCEALRQKGVKAVEINNKTKDRDKILEDYKEGKYDVICNTDLLTEGWDCPNVDCVISLRPTISHSLYLQMHGRGLRNAPNKKNLTVIDFAWETDKDIERPSHLISESVEEEAFIDNLLFTNSNGFDLLEAKKAYDKHLEGQIEEKLKAFNTAEKKQDIEKRINNNSNIDKIKLMDYLTLIDSSIIHTYKNENQNNDISASDQQLKQLESFGLDINIPFFTFTRNLVNSIKEILLERQIQELASPKDMLFLIKNGYSYSANWNQRAVNQIKKNYNFKKDYNIYKWDKAEEKQLQYLQKFEFNNINKWTKESTAELIKVIYNNNDIVPNWINPKTFVPKIDSLQTKILRELGFNNLDKMSNITGSEIIDVLSKNNWDVNKLPYPINTYGNYNKEQCCLHKYVKKTKDDLEERLGFNNKKEKIVIKKKKPSALIITKKKNENGRIL